ncbi:WD40 repeat protein [Winogradskyella wandonensis]|uniref:WD40 repeat protein n=1 Tax=Winogradskyella wandonensis TaxID=1442586 RepID=A0A4V2PTR4_9FLAO|nr:OmpA family protein [Winogradskyella wandonensis]TCK67581.1 WD40 repeat protein [Winogradskyella wandonensis]
MKTTQSNVFISSKMNLNRQNMKQYILLLGSFIFACNVCVAQKERLNRADKYFELKAYAKAAELYEKKEPSQQVLQNLGDSYYYNSNMQKAVKTYRELILDYTDSLDIEYYFKYAQSLKGVKNYKLADEYLTKYYNKIVNTKEFIERNRKSTPHVFKTKTIDNVSTYSDFGLTFFGKDKVAFASTRNENNPAFVWNDLPYLDIYSATLKDGKLENIIPFSDVINTSSHESNPVFSKDGKTMYFNRTDDTKTKTEEGRVAQVKLYKAELINNEWSNVMVLPFSSDEYSTEHPSLSKDGKILYFSSDMPGSIGSFDIYKVAINDDGTYGEPQNLGRTVNTKHREQFPYISDNDVLYYSSNGLIGFGGLDIFRTQFVDNVYTLPTNLGSTVNSNLDDFSFVINEADDMGYFSSNRSGTDKMYSYTREENILTKYMVEGVIRDKNSKAPLAGAKVVLLDDKGNVLQEKTTTKDASYLFKLDPDINYVVKGTSDAYIPQEIKFTTGKDGEIYHNINLELESFSDAEERVKQDETGRVMVQIDKIFFNFNSYKIQPEAAQKLDVLVNLMKKYPSMEVEVSAHTDARGSDDYNLSLSEKRAASTLEYLVSQGIQKSRLTSIGYGETKPLNKCVREGICKDEEYDINRRCEFKVLK